MIEINKFTFNPFQENTYILWDDRTKEAIIVDPGCSTETEESALAQFVETNDLNIKYLINTHCHIDHVFGNLFIKDKYNCDFYAPELDIPLLENVAEQAKMFGMEIKLSPLPDHFITEELRLSLGDSEMKFLFTPGHTPGEYCILFEADNICVSGDVLFLEGIGRTDLWGGDYNTILQSIRNKLFTLDENTAVYPGHGDKTTIGYEIKHNPFLQ
jgi:glyoxylase-like metal-dependent hydrolase (beta-lactamase superfamily II)